MTKTEQRNKNFQHEMAASLASSSGLDEAIEFASLNDWQDVLGELRHLRPGSETSNR